MPQIPQGIPHCGAPKAEYTTRLKEEKTYARNILGKSGKDQSVPAKKQNGKAFIKKTSHEKKYFFYLVKNFPQQIENTREIIENMSEIIQNISDIFFAIYTPTDFQLLARRLFLSAKHNRI